MRTVWGVLGHIAKKSSAVFGLGKRHDGLCSPDISDFTASREEAKSATALVWHFGSIVAITALLLFGGSTDAAAQSSANCDQNNNCSIACDGQTRIEKVCRGTGAVCSNTAFQSFNPATGTNNPQDNLNFTGIPASGATIVYSISSPLVTITGATQQSGTGDSEPGWHQQSNTYLRSNVFGGDQRERFRNHKHTCWIWLNILHSNRAQQRYRKRNEISLHYLFGDLYA